MPNVSNKELLRSNGVPVPQYYNEEKGVFEVIEGRNGANSFIQQGTIAMESWEGSASEVKTFESDRYGFSIVNDGETDVLFTINGNARTVKPYESYSALFEPFTSVDITTTSAYRAEVLR